MKTVERGNYLKRLIGGIMLCTMLFATGKSVLAGPDNIAIHAKATASGELDNKHSVNNINDGLIGISDIGEWASDAMHIGRIKFPWIQLDWDESHLIDKIIFYDRPDLTSHTAGGTLQFSDGTSISVYSIPNDGNACVVEFPAKKVEWVHFLATDGIGNNIGFSEIEVFPSTEDGLDPVSMVDPYIETTQGRYFFFVTGSLPFGMISSAPMTRNINQGGGGYNYNDNEILSFPQVHAWMLSGVEFMPTTGNVNPSLWHDGWKSKFSHDGEIVQPGYHRVFLDKYKTWVEQTCTDRVSFYRMCYTKDAIANILFNLGGYVSTSTMTGANVKKVSDTEIEGSINTVGRQWGGPKNVKMYFFIQLDQPMERLDSWDAEIKKSDVEFLEATNKKILKGTYRDAPTAGVSAQYTMKAGETIKVKISISYTSIENARENMVQECNHWDFDKVREDARAEWNNWMSKIEIKGGTQNQQVKFYTDVWHTLLGRHKLNDFSGDYPDYTTGERKGKHTDAQLKVRTLPRNPDGTAKFNMYNFDALWLTQWNLNTLWGLAWPEVLDDFSASLVQYADNGKLLPRGGCAGGYSYIMTGCPATNMIVSTYMKGLLRKTDNKHAYEVMKQNHEPGGMMGGKEIDFYVKNGWRPDNAGVTLEWAFQDWALGQMASKLNKKKEARYYQKRSTGWKSLYHPELGLVFPKKEDGSWLHTDPLSGKGWVEANAWQATWSVSHDIAGLAELLGGNDQLCEKLNFAFEKAEPADFVFRYGARHVSYSNQPGCSNAHVFNYAGKPWLSQYWVRKVNEQAYGGVTPDKGYGGHDEDQGQMGGVSALMSMGLFSLKGTTAMEPVYEITCPVFDEVKIKLDQKYYKGEYFIIKTNNNSAENCYIQKAELNGKQLNNFWVTHEEFAKGGILELWLGPESNKNWGFVVSPENEN